MVGFWSIIRGPVASAFKVVHSAGGIQCNYYLCTNRNSDPPTYTYLPAIPIQSTPSTKAREVFGSRMEEYIELGSSFYLISRECLKDPSTLAYIDPPTTDDYFYMIGSDGSARSEQYQVKKVIEVGPDPFPYAYHVLVNVATGIGLRG